MNDEPRTSTGFHVGIHLTYLLCVSTVCKKNLTDLIGPLYFRLQVTSFVCSRTTHMGTEVLKSRTPSLQVIFMSVTIKVYP